MKKVLILGADGMLGSNVYGVLKDKYELVLSFRDTLDVELLEKAYGGTNNHRIVGFDGSLLYDDYANKKGSPSHYLRAFTESVGDVDYLINAIGIINTYMLENPAMTFFMNSAFPFILSGEYGEKLIHITTDCVFNGATGYPYDENSKHTPTDIYGLSKSLGEPATSLTLRTSIIGRELKGFSSIIEWFLKQEGKTITGFAEHYWNGITAKQFGKICDQIMSEPDKYTRKGVYHVFSDIVTKYEMLLKFKEKYGINCTIMEDHENKLNRALATVKEMNSLLKIPTFSDMVDEL